MGDALVGIGGAFLAAGILARLGRRVGLPTIPFFMAAGILFGPNTPGLVVIDHPEELELLAALGLILLLFHLGLEFSLGDLVGGGRSLLLTGAIYLGLNVGGGLGFGFALGWGTSEALVIAGAIGISSSAIVTKLLIELRGFENLYYEVCNEPYFGGVTMEWQRRIIDVIVDAEREFAHKHLISLNIANKSAKVEDPHPAVSIFNFHYASPPSAVAENDGLNKAIGDNETGFRGTNDLPYRVEAWEFILAGGGLYNNLDYSFVAGHEDGTFVYPDNQPGGGNPALRRQMNILKSFIHGFDFLRMKPLNSALEAVALDGSHSTRVLAEPGKAYAIYIGPKNPREAAKQKPQERNATIALTLPTGNYRSEWVNTLTGKIDQREVHRHQGGRLVLNSPLYREDIAVKLTKR